MNLRIATKREKKQTVLNSTIAAINGLGMVTLYRENGNGIIATLMHEEIHFVLDWMNEGASTGFDKITNGTGHPDLIWELLHSGYS